MLRNCELESVERQGHRGLFLLGRWTTPRGLSLRINCRQLKQNYKFKSTVSGKQSQEHKLNSRENYMTRRLF
eukprot:5178255-Prorocentrum_lima.AAC.1